MAGQGLKLVQQPPQAKDAPIMSVGGVMPIMGNKQLDEIRRKQRAALDAQQNREEIKGLSHYVDKAWRTARDFKENNVEQRLLAAQRRRNGIYDAQTLQAINEQGGAAIWMHITAGKCRAAAAQLRDALLGTGSDKAWTLSPTPVADLPPNVLESLIQAASIEIQKFQELNGGVMPPDEEVRQLLTEMRDQTLAAAQEEARERAERMEHKMEDQQVEGQWLTALNQLIDDICTFPYAIFKGPVVRSRPTLKWVQGPDGDYTPEASTELRLEWVRVSPFDFYWAPHAENPQDGYCIERIRYTREELNALIGVDGYNEQAIRGVLREYGEGGLREWMRNQTEREQNEGKGQVYMERGPESLIDAIEFHGSVMGNMLIDWGMSAEEVADPDREYRACVTKIGDYVIKAQLNYDPLGRKPYYKTCYESIPGQWCGNSVPDLISDDQDMCNSAARAIANNMGMSSGPQVAVNTDRLPDGEDVTQAFPWKVWQFTNDPMGSTAEPIKFFAPPSMAAELMGVYEKFSQLADEHSGVPRYMQGDTNMGTVGRSATGVSAVMGASSKLIKQVVLNIDLNIIQPALEYQYYYNMKYLKDPDLKGDVKIKARGATSMIQKEAAQVRRNEFLQLVLNSPVVAGVVGEQGIAEMLRQTGKTMDFMNIDKIVPTAAAIARKQAQMQLMQQQAMAAEAAQSGQPTETIQAQYDADGRFTGANVMPAQRSLPNGTPIANNFQPMGQG